MLTCKDVSELSDEWREGSLPFKKMASVKLHLAICKHCRRYLNYLKLTVTVVNEIESSQLNADKIDQVMDRIEAEALKQKSADKTEPLL